MIDVIISLALNSVIPSAITEYKSVIVPWHTRTCIKRDGIPQNNKCILLPVNIRPIAHRGSSRRSIDSSAFVPQNHEMSNSVSGTGARS